MKRIPTPSARAVGRRAPSRRPTPPAVGLQLAYNWPTVSLQLAYSWPAAARASGASRLSPAQTYTVLTANPSSARLQQQQQLSLYTAALMTKRAKPRKHLTLERLVRRVGRVWLPFRVWL